MKLPMIHTALRCAAFGALLMTGWSMAQIGDGPIIREHMDQAQIENGSLDFWQIFDHGELLFAAKFNTYDGQGRPGTTGTGAAREPGSAPAFIRTSAPESNSCAGCHNDPVRGGAGDIVANVFVLAQAADPVQDSVMATFSNERNTLGMHGAGLIEMLSREMTADLHAVRDLAVAQAAETNASVTLSLDTKGVNFGTITAAADGTLDTSAVDGVDADLIIKPFHQKGVVVSLREFSNNAMNHHHGMQSTERFGMARTGTKDFDQDAVEDELTVGDITAISVWQAALGTPGQIIPNDAPRARAILRGERLFKDIGCESCHVSSLTLNDPVFSEPNPYNPEGNLVPAETTAVYTWDMTVLGQGPLPRKNHLGQVEVRAFTDLKRHNLCDDDYSHFCNEQLVQAGVPTEEFLTRKLWDVGSSAPFGHRGDLTTMTEAIHYHGGDARASRDQYFALPQRQRDEIVEFLKSLQILPRDAQSLIVDENGQAKNRNRVVRKNAPVQRDVME
ncbi:di-heme oxidoredictase family protein [Acanthopleuribacter pedis]|uniref:Cytochrome c domain-containing protein n=1 Tax=Acanthopleuribacter pedis TaxID=442870 RepID=A0A8J7QCC4_9BACT|nr:di-heme oxidoredictase family protein [Acanthopleuribacter pedis]MBO1318371.1 hypothetical protein [Acanthopleuribacter pedis]